MNEAARLIADCKKDPDLRNQFISAGAGGFAAVAQSKGYRCSVQDVTDALSGRLSDKQLHSVAGGKIAQSDVPDTMLALLSALRAGLP